MLSIDDLFIENRKIVGSVIKKKERQSRNHGASVNQENGVKNDRSVDLERIGVISVLRSLLRNKKIEDS